LNTQQFAEDPEYDDDADRDQQFTAVFGAQTNKSHSKNLDCSTHFACSSSTL
jgi:hypothetical protein